MTELTALNQEVKIKELNKDNSLFSLLLGTPSTCVLMVMNLYC